jgi:hypothetical protein
MTASARRRQHQPRAQRDCCMPELGFARLRPIITMRVILRPGEVVSRRVIRIEGGRFGECLAAWETSRVMAQAKREAQREEAR